MMTELYDIWQWKKGEIPNEICDYIISNIDSTSFEKGLVNKDPVVDINERNVNIQFSTTNWINALLCGYIRYANHANFHYDLSDWDKEALQISKYSKGEFYKMHMDFGPDIHMTRKLSITVQLSDENDYEGGDLIFYNHPDEKQRVTSVRGKGSIIVFDSRVHHEVTPVTKGVRYSLVKWYHGDEPLK
jgi:PKHD-type hydroxylase